MDQRANRMKTLIINTFFDCLEELDFTQITIGKISDQAMINRSTFYRYFSDKYILRDTIVDDIVKDFADHMEVDFLHMGTLVPIRRAGRTLELLTTSRSPFSR